MIARLRRAWLSWRINALQADMQYACDSFDSYLHEQAEKLEHMRRQLVCEMTSEAIAKQCADRARGAL